MMRTEYSPLKLSGWSRAVPVSAERVMFRALLKAEFSQDFLEQLGLHLDRTQEPTAHGAEGWCLVKHTQPF